MRAECRSRQEGLETERSGRVQARNRLDDVLPRIPRGERALTEPGKRRCKTPFRRGFQEYEAQVVHVRDPGSSAQQDVRRTRLEGESEGTFGALELNGPEPECAQGRAWWRLGPRPFGRLGEGGGPELGGHPIRTMSGPGSPDGTNPSLS